jgi:hypothetical protein
MSDHDSPFDVLLSADMLVDDATAVLATIVDALGIDRPRPSWHQRPDGWGFEAYWCRIGSGLAESPTRLEIISPYGEPDPSLDHPHMREILLAHGDRPAKAHSAPIGVADVAELADRLTQRSARFRLDPPDTELPFPRVWLGVTADEPATYVPDDDAGLRLEFLPTEALGLPAGASEPSVRSHGEPDGRLLGVAARIFTTDDLGTTAGTLARTFDWTPTTVADDDGCGRRATYAFGYERSGVLEVVEPVEGTPEHEHLERWGSGPYGIRLVAHGLEARADDLARRGTPFRWLERGDARVLAVDAAATAGTQFEIVDVR